MVELSFKIVQTHNDTVKADESLIIYSFYKLKPTSVTQKLFTIPLLHSLNTTGLEYLTEPARSNWRLTTELKVNTTLKFSHPKLNAPWSRNSDDVNLDSSMGRLDEDVLEVLYDANTIKARITELSEKIAADYSDKCPVMIAILKGALHFFSDLTRNMDIHMEMDFMIVSSFGGGTESKGSLTIKKDIETCIEGRHVVIVEDIVDSGLTMIELTALLNKRKPASLAVCTLCDKIEGRKYQFTPDYVGFTIPNRFIIGFGLDYDEKYRNVPYIGVLKPSVYTGELPKDMIA
jgi:hypoxanthine phosphoribosyltransferase